MEAFTFTSCILVSLNESFVQTEKFKAASDSLLYTCDLAEYLLVKKERYIDFWRLVRKFNKKIMVTHYFQLLPDFLIPNESEASVRTEYDCQKSLAERLLLVVQSTWYSIGLERRHRGFVTEDYLPVLYDKLRRIEGTVFLPDEVVYGDEYAWYIPFSKLPQLFLILEQMAFVAAY